jgi:CheY-like chemotaxis protein
MDHRLALVVDDSKTARVTLKRMLEKYDIEVDTRESAEQALDYLIGKTPDVIFMDHMMPDMDGFQAVEAIKGNPDTATIPIMMYTSKEGDLYVSQARALGAIGILPKEVEPAELFQVLNNLGLAKDRRSKRSPEQNRYVLLDTPPELALSAATDDMQEIAREAAAAVSGNNRPQGHLAELLESYHHEMVSGINQLGKTVEELASRSPASRQRGSGIMFPLLTMLLMLIPLVWLYNLNNETRAALDSANDQLDRLQSSQQQQQQLASAESASLRKQLDSRENRDAAHERLLYDSITWAINQSSPYDIHEEAFSDRRLAIIQELVSRLDGLGFHGVVQLESRLGEFCLAGSDAEGYVLAPPDLPVTECTLVGHPLHDLSSLGERQSIAFANFLATSPMLESGNISIEIVPFRYSQPLLEYPPQTSDVSAYEWNRIAAVNNRVDVRLEPATEN